MPTRNFVNEIKELQNNRVHIKDKENVNKLISDIIDGGPNKLQVVSDFDRTITKHHENGRLHLSSFGLFTHCPSLSPEYLDAARELNHKYFPMEYDPTIPLPEKRKHMEDWWNGSEVILRGLAVTTEEIDQVAKELGPTLRDGTKELFSDLNGADVPVLVFSAGLGDVVVSVLKNFNVLLPNVKVVSNFLKYENGIIQGFKNAPIHVLNKNEFALKGTEYYELVQNRDNIILMGDSVGDAGMADGVPHSNSVLKIGFIYDHVHESLPHYMDTFDIVLEDDQTMNVAQAILKYML